MSAKLLGSLSTTGVPSLEADPPPHVHGNLRVVFDGYIANRQAIEPFICEESRAADNPDDSMLFAAAFRRWGRNLQRYVIGEYALAVFDALTGSLLLTQDGLAVKPLFVAELADKIVFASHLETLLEKMPAPRLDEAYIADLLAFCRHSGSRTPFQNVTRLLGGETIEWDAGNLKRSHTWDISSIAPVRYNKAESYEEQFRNLLQEAVRASAPPGEKIWIELSGGLDSSSIAAIASDRAICAFDAFSIVFSQTRSADDSRWMRQVIERYDLRWQTIDGDKYLPFSGSSSSPSAFSLPSISAALHEAKYALAQTVGIKVVLSGIGGDNVLVGDVSEPVHMADYLLSGKLSALRSDALDWSRHAVPHRSIRHYLVRCALRPAIARLRGHAIAAGPRVPLPSYLHPDLVRRYSLRRRAVLVPGLRGGTVGDQHYRERLRDVALGLATSLDQPRRGIEYRYPLLYRPLVEFMYAIPWEQKVHPTADRYLQRRALRGILPEQIRVRRDKGSANEPCIRGLAKAGPVLRARLAENSRLAHYGFVDDQAWRNAVDRATLGSVECMSSFLIAASLELWLQRLHNRSQCLL